MLKKELFVRLEKLNVDVETLMISMFDWFDSNELKEFVEHLEDELSIDAE